MLKRLRYDNYKIEISDFSKSKPHNLVYCPYSIKEGGFEMFQQKKS